MSEALLFDIDGTLVDSTYHHTIAWRRAFDSLEVAVPVWRIHRTIGMGGDKLVAEVAGERVEARHGDDLRAAWRDAYTGLKHEVAPLPGAAELVREVVRRGYRVALASSGDPQFSREAVTLLGIGEEIELLTTAEDADESKPDPDLLSVTLHRLGGVRRAVLVGDTPYDVEAARRARLPCIALRSGGYGAAELTEAGAVLVADGPEALHDLDWNHYLKRRGNR